MKKIKLLLAGIVVIASLQTSFAQDKKTAKINTKIDALNQKIIAADEALALTEVQKTALFKLYEKNEADMKALKAEGLAEEVMAERKKAINKEMTKQINMILTPEQKQAKKNAQQ